MVEAQGLVQLALRIYIQQVHRKRRVQEAGELAPSFSSPDADDSKVEPELSQLWQLSVEFRARLPAKGSSEMPDERHLAGGRACQGGKINNCG